MDKRINWIDWAKAIGIFFVVFGHMKFNEADAFYQNLIYTFHMPLFFLISGYLFKVNDDLKNFFCKNLTSLIVPYILLNIVTFLIFYFPNVSIQTIKPLFISFITGESHAPAGPCWFLLCLFIVRALAFYLFKLQMLFQLIFLIISPIIAYIITNIFNIDLYLGFDTSFLAIIFFSCGYYLKKYLLLEKLYSKKWLTTTLFIISIPSLFYITTIQGRVDIYSCNFGNFPLLYYPVSFLGCFVILMFCLLFNNINLYTIRNISLGTLLILAMHGPMVGYIYKILFKLNGILVINAASHLLVAFIIVLLFIPFILFVKKYFPILIGNRN